MTSEIIRSFLILELVKRVTLVYQFSYFFVDKPCYTL